MPAVTLKRYEQILQSLINTVVARSDLSDITDSSTLKHILASFARELDELYYNLGLIPDRFNLDTAVGSDLDARALEVQPAVITRNLAAIATGSVVFSRVGTVGTIAIPIGVTIKTASGVKFTTTAAGQILNGFSSSAAVAASADEAGTAGNVAANTITKFDAKPAGVNTVTNPSSFSNGADEETDDAFRARIKSFIATLARSTVQALEFIAGQTQLANGQRVAFAHAVEDIIERGEVILYIDDGAGTAETVEPVVAELVTTGLAGPGGDSAVGGEEFLYLNEKPIRLPDVSFQVRSPANLPHFAGRGVLTQGTDYFFDDASGQLYFTPALVAGEQIEADYTAFTGLIEEVQKVIDGDPSDRVNYPGWRAAGVRVRVKVPQILQQVVEGSVSVREGYTQADVLVAAEAAVSAYINALGISGDVVKNEIIERVMALPGVYNFSLTQPASDVIVLDDQLPRVTSGNILLS